MITRTPPLRRNPHPSTLVRYAEAAPRIALAHGAVPCPECGMPLNVDEEAETFPERKPVRVGFCGFCDFTHAF